VHQVGFPLHALTYVNTNLITLKHPTSYNVNKVVIKYITGLVGLLCKIVPSLPRKRWSEDVEEDIQRMGIRGWMKLCKERTEWNRITEKAKTHSGL